MDKIKKLKELIKKAKKGVQSLKKLIAELGTDIKQMIIEFTIKKVAMLLLQYVIIPIAIIGAAFVILYYVFIGAFQLLAGLFGDVSNAFKFFFWGRSGEVDSEQVAVTKQELEKAGVEFDEIGYLGEQYLVDEKIKLNIKGFVSSDGNFNSDNDSTNEIKIELDSDDNIPFDENSARALIEYKNFLEKKMKENNIEVEVVIEKGESLQTLLTQYNGKKVKIKQIKEETTGTGATLEKAKYYTVSVTDDAGNYEIETEENDYYKEYQKIKNEAIMWYLTKDYESQAFTFKNENWLSLDGDDIGGIKIYFPNDTEKNEAYSIPGAIGLEQKAFYNSFGTFGVMNKDDGKFYSKLNDTAGAVYNTDITSFVFDYAMPWNYPFAFHESTLAPDIGYLVSRLAMKYHKLELQVYALVPRIENPYTGDMHPDSPKPEASGGHIEVVRTHQSTWYRNIDTQYVEQDIESSLIGHIYNMEKHEIKYVEEIDYTQPIDDDGDGTTDRYGTKTRREENVVPTDKAYYVAGAELTTPITASGTWGDGAEDYYVTTTVKNDVKEIISGLVQTSHLETTNPEGINDMDCIMQSIPEYKYDASSKRRTLQNGENLKYYYTANKYIEKNAGTYKFKLTSDPAEKTYTIKGKTMLQTDQVAQSIIDSVYNIYDDDEDVKNNLNKEIDVAKGSSITTSEFQDLKNSNHDREKDYTLAKPIVKELIAYFWNMGALDPNNASLKMVGESIYLSTFTGSIYVWPVEQPSSEIGNFTYDPTTKTATISAAMGAKVLSPVNGTVSRIEDNTDGTKTVYITQTKTVNIDGVDQEVTETHVLGNLQSTTVTAGSTVTANNQIGVANGPITYQVLAEDGSAVDMQEDLKNMAISAKSSFKWPIKNPKVFINSHYGPRTLRGEYNMHWGVDFNLEGQSIEGQPIYPSRDGTVILVRNTVTTRTGGSGWGNYIKIDHGDNTYTLYAHMGPGSIKVTQGQAVTTDTVIGNVGTTGNSTGPHLHFEIYVGGPTYKTNNVDPEPYLKGEARIGNNVTYATTGTSTNFVAMLHSFEGTGGGENATQYRVYKDSYGYLTVGYGVTFKDNKEAFKKRGIDVDQLGSGDYIDKSIVDSIEQEEINAKKKEIANILEKSGITNLSDKQIEALVIRCYQLGTTGGLGLSSKYEKNGRSFAEAYKEFGNTQPLGDQYLLVCNSSLAGLHKRRKAEWVLFHEGRYTNLDQY